MSLGEVPGHSPIIVLHVLSSPPTSGQGVSIADDSLHKPSVWTMCTLLVLGNHERVSNEGSQVSVTVF